MLIAHRWPPPHRSSLIAYHSSLIADPIAGLSAFGVSAVGVSVVGVLPRDSLIPGFPDATLPLRVSNLLLAIAGVACGR